MRYFKHFLIYIWLLVLVKQITAETIVKNRQIHTDIDLSCNDPQGTRRWFYQETADSMLVPITAENGSHYEIQANIAGLRIINSVESDEGIYIVQGDGGVECQFTLKLFGIFSFNSGAKNQATGNYEQTIEVVNNYAATVACDYNITGVSDAQSTFVNVEAVVKNTNVQECTENQFPYCSDCEACFPKMNNPYKQFIVYAKMDSGSTTVVCRVNLGTNYNGKTVDKIVTFSRTTVSADSYVVPYNSTHQLCNNTPGNKTGIILTTEFSGGIPINRIAYSLDELPSSVINTELKLSCQNLNIFPNNTESYEYDIKLSAIPDFTNIRLDETINISDCGGDSTEINRTFDCSYELIGNSDGQQQNKIPVVWELDGTSCSGKECTLSGDYSEVNTMDIRELGNETAEYYLKCYVELNGVEYYKEWRIYLNVEGCVTSSETTTKTTTTTTTTITTNTPSIVIVSPTDPISNGLPDPGLIAGITVGVLLCIIFLIVLIILIAISVAIVYYSPYRLIYHTGNANDGEINSTKRCFHLPKLSGKKSYSRQLDNTTQEGDITITV